jgi:hypothetical protein
MNVANLQLEGMLLALMALLDSIKRKGVRNGQEIDDALETAEANALSDPVRLSGLSDSNMDWMLFRFGSRARQTSRQRRRRISRRSPRLSAKPRTSLVPKSTRLM